MTNKEFEVSVIIPTYNEGENIKKMIEEVFKCFEVAGIRGEVLVVDDNSPDGTGKIAEELKKVYESLEVLIRKNEKGLSSAAIHGFKIARGEILCVIDADFSHPPAMIQKLVDEIKLGADIVIGSRYIKDGGVKDWTLKRKIISKGATILAKFITAVKDPMSGFFALKRRVIEGVELNPKGYKIGLEIIAKGNYEKIVEVPYIFEDRKLGKSKMNMKIMREYLAHLLGILFAKNSIFRQFFKFCVVGAVGTLINIGILYILVEWFFIWYIFSATISFGVAVTSNYILNKAWTFYDKRKKISVVFESYIIFILVSLVGLAINLSMLYILVEYFKMWYIFAQILAIILAVIWNYIGSRIWVFGKQI